jgi:hypothetical protein
MNASGKAPPNTLKNLFGEKHILLQSGLQAPRGSPTPHFLHYRLKAQQTPNRGLPTNSPFFHFHSRAPVMPAQVMHPLPAPITSPVGHKQPAREEQPLLLLPFLSSSVGQAPSVAVTPGKSHCFTSRGRATRGKSMVSNRQEGSHFLLIPTTARPLCYTCGLDGTSLPNSQPSSPKL